MQERHPKLDADYLLAEVTRHLGPIELKNFLEFDTATTTNPGALRNPPGHYVELAKRMVADARRATRKALKRTLVPVGETPRCQLCKGLGKLDGGEYCSCQMGKDLANLAVRDARRSAPPAPRSACVGSSP
jgi:hypothetical protein